jgi:hypothetical protein
MYFTAEQVDIMRIILRRLDNKTIESLQIYTKDNDLRTGCTQVIHNKWKKPICIFQNYEKLSDYRMRLILRLSEQIPFEIHITEPQEGITRIGWKCVK